MSAVIVWFRDDLRLEDHAAFHWAMETGLPIIPLFIYDDKPRPLGGATRWWLHHSLDSLYSDIQALGGHLVVAAGEAEAVLNRIISQTNAQAITWHRRYDQASIAHDSRLKSALKAKGLEVRSFQGNLLFEPHTLLNKEGKPFKVFTPFWKHCLTLPQPHQPLPKPRDARFAANLQALGTPLETLKLRPTHPDWAGGLRESWQVREQALPALIDDFIATKLALYKEERNRPDLQGTSRLSPYLRFGQLSVRALWHRLQAAIAMDPQLQAGGDTYLSELGWREFSYHLLHHNPGLPDAPLQSAFANFPWLDDDEALKCWQKGHTGYPIVDAAMRQLWHTGWMHNRARMIVGSFLVKDLLIPWQKGEAWFWDTLVDADLASNSASWQWVAGCGADAAPYFRVFNPLLQAQKFDPQGDYVRRWVPELANIPAPYIHTPHLGPYKTAYPMPMVDHDHARKRALAAYANIKKA